MYTVIITASSPFFSETLPVQREKKIRSIDYPNYDEARKSLIFDLYEQHLVDEKLEITAIFYLIDNSVGRIIGDRSDPHRMSESAGDSTDRICDAIDRLTMALLLGANYGGVIAETAVGAALLAPNPKSKSAATHNAYEKLWDKLMHNADIFNRDIRDIAEPMRHISYTDSDEHHGTEAKTDEEKKGE